MLARCSSARIALNRPHARLAPPRNPGLATHAAYQDAALPSSPLSGTKVLVAGATGGVGRQVVEVLVQAGVPCRALVRDLDKARSSLPMSSGLVELVRGDVFQFASLPGALGDAGCVVCATGASGLADPLGPFNVDYQGTANLVAAAKQQGVKKFVLVTSIGADDLINPLNLFYGVLFWKKSAMKGKKRKGAEGLGRPGKLGKWVDRDCNAALNLQRAGESKWRPLELCRWQHRGRLPAQGKEYPALGFKKLRERAPKAQAQQPRGEEVLQRSGLDYTIIRPGGLKNQLRAGEVAGNVVARGPGFYGVPPRGQAGSILRRQVAEVCVAALSEPAAANKVVEVIATPDAPALTYAQLFATCLGGDRAGDQVEVKQAWLPPKAVYTTAAALAFGQRHAEIVARHSPAQQPVLDADTDRHVLACMAGRLPQPRPLAGSVIPRPGLAVEQMGAGDAERWQAAGALTVPEPGQPLGHVRLVVASSQATAVQASPTEQRQQEQQLTRGVAPTQPASPSAPALASAGEEAGWQIPGTTHSHAPDTYTGSAPVLAQHLPGAGDRAGAAAAAVVVAASPARTAPRTVQLVVLDEATAAQYERLMVKGK
ncbi:hypothetical protein QJQ45_000786 [Haematococcus lacustris]|nr:hypothetical protein QJQ45_000786 [Haematococcus lacustris]